MSSTTFVERPEIPLTPDVRKAYEDLYAQYEDKIENTTDTDLLKSLNASQLQVAAVLSQDDVARIQQNTAAYAAVLTQIEATNKGLDALQAQIKKVAGDISLYAGIVSGIAKVLSLVPL